MSKIRRRNKKEWDVEKKTIEIGINKYNADDGGQFYRVCDGSDWESPAECSYGGGWYLDEYAINNDIAEWEEKYNIVIIKDYR